MARGIDTLSEKQRRFVEAYMGEAAGNGVEAARMAGYKGSRRSLAVTAHELLKKPLIITAIAERVAEDPLVASRKECLQGITAIARGEARTKIEIDGVVKEILIPIEIKDRNKAYETLGKAHGIFVEKQEISGPNGGPIKTELGLSDEAAEQLKRKVLGIGADK